LAVRAARGIRSRTNKHWRIGSAACKTAVAGERVSGGFKRARQNFVAGKVLELYRRRLELGEIEPDPAQAGAAEKLDELACKLVAWKPGRARLLSLFSRPRPNSPRGLYIYGAVGRGKTMLMDLFFEAVDFAPKSRHHFHEFMAEVHERIGRARHAVDGDPIPYVASDMAAEAGLLCFDEFHVTDIADAMILGRLFRGLFEKGVVVVATSNCKPTNLYKDGLNRQLFLPCIHQLEEQMEVFGLKSAKDFRLEKLAGFPLYFSPADAAAREALDKHWQRLTGGHKGEPRVLEVLGRQVPVPLASMGVARFDFVDLCDRPLGANDYLHICHAFHTVMIEGIPVLNASRRNEARRFITLVDTLYDNGVCLIASAEAEPAKLYPEGDGADLFERTVSRLMEMRSEAYLLNQARRSPAAHAAVQAGRPGPKPET
jgi:cell division protein ZapE